MSDPKARLKANPLELTDALITPQQPDALIPAGDGTMRFYNYTLTRCGLLMSGTADQGVWEQLGALLFSLEGSIQFLIGDWLLQAEREYGLTYKQIAEYFEREVDTMYTYAWVCRQVNFSIRVEKLSFGHHRLVAGLETEQQRALLAHAAENNLSVRAFEAYIKGGRKSSKGASLPAEQLQAKRYGQYIETELPGIENAPERLRRQMAERADWLSAYYAEIARQARGG